jgi:hypothetical protein
MPTSQQPDITKLDTYYKHALDNSGNQQFYTYLYKYMDTIATDEQLNRAANDFFWDNLIKDFKFKSDEKKLLEIAKPLLFLDNNKPSQFQILMFMQDLFGQITSTRIKETKLSYCWYVIYFSYYCLYQIDPEVFEKLSHLNSKAIDMKEFSEYFGKDVSADELDSINFKEVASVFKSATESSTPYKSPFSQEVYVTSLHLFHIDFMNWLPQHSNTKLPMQDKPVIQPITNLKLEPKNYDAANGILNIAGLPIEIIKQPNKKGSAFKESKQARVMRLVFNDVNSLKDGVPMRRIISVRERDFNSKHRKLVKSYVSEINSKLPKELGISELLICSQFAVMVDNRYLL